MELIRSCIYPKDVQRITGRSERYCRRLLKKLRSDLKREEHQYITIDEFAQFVGLEPDLVRKYITD